MAPRVLVCFETTIISLDEEIVFEIIPSSKSSNKQKAPLALVRKRRQLKDEPSLQKYQNGLAAIQEEEAIVLRAKPVSGALSALHDMRKAGLDVRLLLNYHAATAKLKWISAHIGKDWMARSIVCGDWSLISCDFIVDTFESLPDSTSWTPIVLSAPFNASIEASLRIRDWTEWKSALPMKIAEKATVEWIAHFRHGSEDSRDRDVLYQVAKWPSDDVANVAIQSFVSGVGDEDRNIFSVNEDGYVCRCWKGLPDEVNNGLYSTYSLHSQSFPLPIVSKTQRSVISRVVVALRAILVKLRRNPILRDKFKQALSTFEFSQRRSTVGAVDFCQVGPTLTDEELKYVAFHLCQSISLIHGEELFTKKALVTRFSSAHRLLYPTQGTAASPVDFKLLDGLKSEFISLTENVRVVKMRAGDLQLFLLEPNRHAKASKAPNLFQYQCHGHVVDMVEERVVHFGLLPEIPLQQAPQWPQYPLHAPDDLENIFLLCFHNNKLELAAMTGWSIPRDVASFFNDQRMKTIIDTIDFDKWYIIVYFSSNDDDAGHRLFPPKLYAARHRWSGILAPREVLADMATKAGFAS